MSFNPFIPIFPFPRTFAFFASWQLNPMIIRLFTALFFGIYEASFFNWLISVWWYWTKLYATFSPGQVYLSTENRGNYSFYVLMCSFRQFGSNAIGLYLTMLLEIFLQFGNLPCILLSVGKKLTTPYVFILLSLFDVTYGQFFLSHENYP